MKSNKLKSILVLKKITQSDLAKRKGVTLNTINNQINGKTLLSSKDISFYCNALSISDPYIICDIFLDSIPKIGKSEREV